MKTAGYKKRVFGLSLTCLVGFVFPAAARAQDKLISQNYRIENEEAVIGSRNIESAKPAPIPNFVDLTDFFAKTGYKITPDADNSREPFFQISLSPAGFYFENLTAEDFNDAAVQLSIENAPDGFSGRLLALAGLNSGDHPLVNQVFCDPGDSPCTPYRAAGWTRRDVKGLGISAAGDFSDPDFVSNNYFRSLPYPAKNELPAVFARSSDSAAKAELKLLLRLNDQNINENENYSGSMEIIILPGY